MKFTLRQALAGTAVLAGVSFLIRVTIEYPSTRGLRCVLGPLGAVLALVGVVSLLGLGRSD